MPTLIASFLTFFSFLIRAFLLIIFKKIKRIFPRNEKLPETFLVFTLVLIFAVCQYHLFITASTNSNKISMVIIVFGLPGSGKSYFASKFANLIKATYINSDLERKKMIANRTYSEKEKLSVYNTLLVKMKEHIKQNRDLVLDATFNKNDIRKKFIKAAQPKVDLFFIEVRTSETLAMERLKEIRPDSEADFEVYKKIEKQWEPLNEDHLILYSGDNNITGMLQKAAEYLQIKNDKRAN